MGGIPQARFDTEVCTQILSGEEKGPISHGDAIPGVKVRASASDVRNYGSVG